VAVALVVSLIGAGVGSLIISLIGSLIVLLIGARVGSLVETLLTGSGGWSRLILLPLLSGTQLLRRLTLNVLLTLIRSPLIIPLIPSSLSPLSLIIPLTTLTAPIPLPLPLSSLFPPTQPLPNQIHRKLTRKSSLANDPPVVLPRRRKIRAKITALERRMGMLSPPSRGGSRGGGVVDGAGTRWSLVYGLGRGPVGFTGCGIDVVFARGRWITIRFVLASEPV